jgi:hypothetical protein
MISDTLCDAVSEIDRYLIDDGAGGHYTSDRYITAWIVSVREQMELLRRMLDTHPDGSVPPHRPCPIELPGGSYEALHGERYEP